MSIDDMSTERRTVGWYTVFHPNGTKINLTVRGGATAKDVADDFAVIFESVSIAESLGFRFTPTGQAPSVELATLEPQNYRKLPIVEIRDVDSWVRAKSRNGEDVIYCFADGLNLKRVNCYDSFFNQLPISQEEFDNAAVWNQPTAPDQDQAETDGYLNRFPARVRIAMFDTGKVFNNNPVLYPDQVIGTASRGLQGSTKAIPNQGGQPSGKSSKPNADVPINASGGQCPHCHAPAGKPHASNCPARDGGSSPATDPAKIPGVTRGVSRADASRPTKRQQYAAAAMLLGEYIDGDKWDAARESAVSQMTDGAHTSAADLTDDQIAILVSNLREVVEMDVDGIPEDVIAGILNRIGYMFEYQGASKLPSTFLVKLAEECRKIADESDPTEEVI